MPHLFVTPLLRRQLCAAFTLFWRRSPAFLWGLHLLLGCGMSAATASQALWLGAVFLSLLWLPVLLWPGRDARELLLKLSGGLILAIAGFIYGEVLGSSPPWVGEKQGVGYFEIEAVYPSQTPFHKTLVYRGTLRSFRTADGEEYKNLPCFASVHKKRSSADCDYLVEGLVQRHEKGRYHLKAQRWQAVPDTTSLAEWRYRAKEKVRKLLQDGLPDMRSYGFLSALATGDAEDRELLLEFNRLGLQHILAISGADFALLALLCGWGLQLLFGRKIAAALLLLLLSGYFFFLGSTPPIQRAWLGIAIFLVGRLCDLHAPGLNILGVALLVQLIVDPCAAKEVGFQLSFLCTLAILVAYPSCSRALEWLWPRRPLALLRQMSRLEQHGYLAMGVLREACALNLAVHLFALPLLLYLFQTFPLLSLLYNLFVPALLSLSLLVLLPAVLLSFCLPPVGALLHQINSAYTAAVLEVIAHPLTPLEGMIRVSSFPFPLLLILLSALFFVSVSLPLLISEKRLHFI